MGIREDLAADRVAALGSESTHTISDYVSLSEAPQTESLISFPTPFLKFVETHSTSRRHRQGKQECVSQIDDVSAFRFRGSPRAPLAPVCWLEQRPRSGNWVLAPLHLSNMGELGLYPNSPTWPDWGSLGPLLR